MHAAAFHPELCARSIPEPVVVGHEKMGQKWKHWRKSGDSWVQGNSYSAAMLFAVPSSETSASARFVKPERPPNWLRITRTTSMLPVHYCSGLAPPVVHCIFRWLSTTVRRRRSSRSMSPTRASGSITVNGGNHVSVPRLWPDCFTGRLRQRGFHNRGPTRAGWAHSRGHLWTLRRSDLSRVTTEKVRSLIHGGGHPIRRDVIDVFALAWGFSVKVWSAMPNFGGKAGGQNRGQMGPNRPK